MERSFRVATEQEMLKLGKRIGSLLQCGGFVALVGDLGAGKSVFARGVAAHLGIVSLTSPTFTIVQEYPCEPPLFHFDAYRLSDEDELYAIGFSDYLNRNGIILMEWANLVPGCLPKDRLDVFIAGSGMEERTVRLCPNGPDYETLVKDV